MEMQVQKKKEVIWNIKRKSLPGGFQLRAIQSGSGIPEVILSMYETDDPKKIIQFTMNLDEFQNYFAIISAFYTLLESGDIDSDVQVNGMNSSSATRAPTTIPSQNGKSGASIQAPPTPPMPSQIQQPSGLPKISQDKLPPTKSGQVAPGIEKRPPNAGQIPLKVNLKGAEQQAPSQAPSQSMKSNTTQPSQPTQLQSIIQSQIQAQNQPQITTPDTKTANGGQINKNVLEKYQQAKKDLQKSVNEVKSQSNKATEIIPPKQYDKVSLSMSLESPQDARDETREMEAENFDEMVGLTDQNVIEGLSALDEMMNNPPEPTPPPPAEEKNDGFEKIDAEPIHTVFKKGTKLEETEWDPW